MYEDKTYEAILQEKLARVASSLDKREGSIIFDALAPNSLESAMIYVALDTVLNETFADTASRDYLIMRCAERGITPLPATCAVGIGEFSMDIPIGTRFSCDKYNWVVTEKIESLKYYLTCETAGADPNGYTGQLIPIEYIEGLATAELTSIVINGEDEEATETLRLRYLNSFENQSYGFNRGQYIEVTEALPGVGGCKPYRAWKGPGTVKLVITGSDYQPPSDTLINTVQTAIDPTQNSGDGIGLAPIDHEVTVVGAAGQYLYNPDFRLGLELDRVPPVHSERSRRLLSRAQFDVEQRGRADCPRIANRVEAPCACRYRRYFRHDPERSGGKSHAR